MNARRSSIRTVAIVLGGLLLQAGAASAQHGGGGHGGGGHGGGGHYGGGHYGGSHYGGGGGHYGGYYGRSGYYGGHYYPRFYLYGGLYGRYGYPYYYGYGYPYYPYGGYRYGGGYGYGGYGYGGYQYDETGVVRLLVEPDEARVFVDGYYAGTADDLDGASQGLRLQPGRHQIVLKLEGYRTHRIEVYAPAGQTLRVHYRMARGTGEDVAEDLTPEEYLDESGGRGGGELRLTVRPGDAVIYVDGEFRGPGRQVRRLELPPGRHSIEVARPGYQTFERAVDVERDRPVDLDVELRPAGS